jgi:hypothetical protein
MLYVYNVNTGWTSYDLGTKGSAQNLAITIPGVGAYLSGYPTVAHTWCPSGIVGDYDSMIFYPQAATDTVPVQTDILAATTDGQHILGASLSDSYATTLVDIGVAIPNEACTVTTSGPVSNPVQTLTPLSTSPKLLTQTPIPVGVYATAINQVVASPASNLAFLTYTGTTTGAPLPYYIPGSDGNPGVLNYVTLMNGSSPSNTVTAPLAGAFSPDNKLFFVSTSGDNLIHYIDVQKLTDTQQIAPNLPGVNGGTVPATAIAVKPRSIT